MKLTLPLPTWQHGFNGSRCGNEDQTAEWCEYDLDECLQSDIRVQDDQPCDGTFATTLHSASHYSLVRSNNGTILCYFDKKSVRLISSDVGRVVIRRLSGLLDAYLVIAGNNIITVGHRYKRIKDY